MKIKKNKTFQYTLLKLNLIKSQVYKKKIQPNHYDDVLNTNTQLIELHFKRALQVISKYHMNHKKILFIGVPQIFQKKFSKILKNTKHIAIPQSIWINGILTNRPYILRSFDLKRQKYIKKNWLQNKIIYFLISMMKRPNLIVVFDSNFKKNKLKETYKLKLPIITLDSNLYFFDSNFFFKVPGNFQQIYKKTHHTILLALASILKKVPKKQYFWS